MSTCNEILYKHIAALEDRVQVWHITAGIIMSTKRWLQGFRAAQKISSYNPLKLQWEVTASTTLKETLAESVSTQPFPSEIHARRLCGDPPLLYALPPDFC